MDHIQASISFVELLFVHKHTKPHCINCIQNISHPLAPPVLSLLLAVYYVSQLYNIFIDKAYRNTYMCMHCTYSFIYNYILRETFILRENIYRTWSRVALSTQYRCKTVKAIRLNTYCKLFVCNIFTHNFIIMFLNRWEVYQLWKYGNYVFYKSCLS